MERGLSCSIPYHNNIYATQQQNTNFFFPFILLFYSLFFFFFFFAKYYVFHFGFAAKHFKCICHSSCNWSWIWVAILSTGWVPLLSARADTGGGGGSGHCRVLSRKRGFLIATERMGGKCVCVCGCVYWHRHCEFRHMFRSLLHATPSCSEGVCLPHSKRQHNQNFCRVMYSCKRVLLQFSPLFSFTFALKLKQTAVNEHLKRKMAIQLGKKSTANGRTVFRNRNFLKSVYITHLKLNLTSNLTWT